MLTSLSIRDFAIIRALDVDLRRGFSAITGETGAGKSIVVEAVSLALGSRADTSYVRTGTEKAFIELGVETDDRAVLDALSENGIESDGTLLITRELSAAGKSVCRINGSPVTVGFLNAIAKRLCDIHGQYEHQTLLNPESHISYLDSFGEESLRTVKATVSSLFETYSDLSRKIATYEKACAESKRKRDFMAFELDEITKAAPKPLEDAELEEELLLLKNSETIYANLTEAHTLLSGDEGDASSRLASSVRLLGDVKSFSPGLFALYETLETLSYELDDLSREIRRATDSVSFSEERLNEIQERLEVLNGLKRKYGPALSDVIQYAEKLKEELSFAEATGKDAELWKAEKAVTEEQLLLASSRLSALRREAATRLEEKMGLELASLNFSDARFSCAFSDAPLPFSPNGTDAVEFLISANKGEALKPLVRVASGGELSRIMLAFKSIASARDSVPTMFFDEVDQGISGITASVVAKKMRELSHTHQIIAITHLPQIAAYADDHFRIAKSDDTDRTITTLMRLDADGRVEEIARLLGGLSISDATVQAAKDLLASSR